VLASRLGPQPCPVCRTALGADRIVRAAEHSPRDRHPYSHEYDVACPGCLAIARFVVRFDPAVLGAVVERAPRVEAVAVQVQGATVARLRERLTAAEDAGRLSEEVVAVLSDSALAPLASAPEFLPLLRRGLADGFVRCAAHSEAFRHWTRFDAWDEREATWDLHAMRDVLTNAEIREAFSDGGLGGVLLPPDVANRRHVLRMLKSTRLEIRGVLDGKLVLALPRAADRAGYTGVITAPYGLVLADRVGRPA